MLSIHTIYIGTENKRTDGKPIPAVHNFKTDFKINRKSRRLSSSAGSGQGLVAESCRYTGKEIPTHFYFSTWTSSHQCRKSVKAPQQKFLQVTRKTDRNDAERIHHTDKILQRHGDKQLWINYILQASEVFNSRPLISRMSSHDSGLDTANGSIQLISSGIIKSFRV